MGEPHQHAVRRGPRGEHTVISRRPALFVRTSVVRPRRQPARRRCLPSFASDLSKRDAIRVRLALLPGGDGIQGDGAARARLVRAHLRRSGAAARFYAREKWDFEAAESTYLERAAAALAPGRFPEALGPDYPKHAEEVLLARSHSDEQAGDTTAALASAEILQKLAPQSPHALDRLAYLHQRAGRPEQAVPYLEVWHDYHPNDPRPVVRFALLLHQRGLTAECQTKLREALPLCDGARRARIAFLGARLTLQKALAPVTPESNGSSTLDATALAHAEDWLQQCLAADSRHAEALWCLAAVRWLRGDLAGLANQSQAMDESAVPDVRYQYFKALCELAADNLAGVLNTCANMTATSANKDKPTITWPVESAYLSGLAHWSLQEWSQAVADLEKPARRRRQPVALPLAQALLGAIAFQADDAATACQWWQMLEPKQRSAWKLGETLSSTMFLTALTDAGQGRFEKAAERLRAAGKLGCRDRRLGPLLLLALFKAVGRNECIRRSSNARLAIR